MKARRKLLRTVAFKKDTPLLDAEAKDHKIRELIYEGNAPCYESKEDKFGKQCHTLINKLRSECEDLTIVIPKDDKGECLKQMDHRLTAQFTGDGMYYAKQPDLFYATVKTYLETICILLHDPDIAKERKTDVMVELLPKLLVCGPGLYLHLSIAVSKLSSHANIDNWLTELRTNIIKELAVKFISKHHTREAIEIHVYNVFMKKAIEKGWHPAESDEIAKLKDQYADYAEVKEKDLTQFEEDFLQAYSPKGIVDFLTQKLYEEINDIITEHFILDNNGEINIDIRDPGNAYEYGDVVDSLKHLYEFGGAQDFFTANEEYTKLKFKSEDCIRSLILNRCLAKKLFAHVKDVHIGNDCIQTIYCDPHPPYVLLNGLYGVEAQKYFYDNRSWEKISLVHLHTFGPSLSISQEVFDYYYSRGETLFGKLNLNDVLIPAILAKDMEKIKLLLRIGIDITYAYVDGTKPINIAVKMGAWEVVALLAKYRNTDENDEAGYDLALLDAVKVMPPQVEAVQALLRAHAKPENWYIETHNHVIHCAVRNGNLDILSALIEAGVDFSKTNLKNQTAMDIAVEIATQETVAWEVVAYIADHKAIDKNDSFHYHSAFLAAIQAGQLEAMQALLRAGVNINAKDPNTGNTALHIAVLTSNKAMIAALIDAGASLSEVDANNKTPMQVAAAEQLWEIVTFIANYSDTNKVDEAKYRSALFSAVRADKIQSAKALLDARAPTTSYEEETHLRLLHYAIQRRNLPMIDLLMDAKTSLAKKNIKKQTPIELAAEQGDWEIVMHIAKRQKTNAEDSFHYAPVLYQAAKANQLDVVRVLAQANASVNWQHPETKCSPLHDAIQTHSTEMIELLVELGADVSLVNADKQNPIEIAADQGEWDRVMDLVKANPLKNKNDDNYHYGRMLLNIFRSGDVGDDVGKQLMAVQVLLQANAPTHWHDTDTNFTLLHYAVQNLWPDMIKLLIQSGINVGVQDKQNRTAAEIAAELELWDMVFLMEELHPTNEKDSAKITSIFLNLVKNDKIELVEKLLNINPNFSLFKSSDDYALHLAIENRNLAMLTLLINAGAKLTETNSEDKTPMQVAVDLGAWDIVKHLADTYPTDHKDEAHYSYALYKAIKADKKDMVDLLLTANTPVNHSELNYPQGPLHIALQNHRTDMLPLLMQAGAKISMKNNDKKTVMQAAALQGDWEAVILIATEAPTHRKDKGRYRFALLEAIKASQDPKAKEAVAALLKAKTSTTWQEPKTGYCALHYAILYSALDLVDWLIQEGDNLTLKDSQGRTPIVLAAEMGLWSVVILIANSHHTDDADEADFAIALSIAEEAKQWDAVKILQGANTPRHAHETQKENKDDKEDESYDNDSPTIEKESSQRELRHSHHSDHAIKPLSLLKGGLGLFKHKKSDDHSHQHGKHKLSADKLEIKRIS